MIAVKIAGSILVMLSSSLVGFYYANKEKYRINDLEELKKLLMILRAEIEFSVSSLPEAMENISHKSNKKFSCFFKDVSDRLNAKNGDSINQIWDKALDKNLGKTYLVGDDISYIKSLGSSLGYLDKKLQLNSIGVIIEYINSTIEALYDTSLKNKKMYSSLGVLGGLLITIVLL